MMMQLLGFVVVPVALAGLGWGAAITHVRGLQRDKGNDTG
jgi:hypothetical protein